MCSTKRMEMTVSINQLTRGSLRTCRCHKNGQCFHKDYIGIMEEDGEGWTATFARTAKRQRFLRMIVFLHGTQVDLLSASFPTQSSTVPGYGEVSVQAVAAVAVATMSHKWTNCKTYMKTQGQ